MVILNKLVAAVAVTVMTVSPAFAASLRPSIVQLPVATAKPVPLKMGMRVGRQVAKTNNLLGAPLFLALMGSVAVTVGTIAIVNNNGPASPQGR